MEETRANLRVVIAGPRLAGNMIASKLKLDHPELDVVVCGKSDRSPPVVGESLTEFSTQFLYQIGMKEVLENEHYPKYGLTFYYKQDINDPGDGKYFVHEAPDEPPMPAHLINRTKFDKSLRRRSEEHGVRFIESDVKDIEIGKGTKSHRVILKERDENGENREIECRWFVDATGRARFLGRKLSLHQPIELQRDSFWFRLADFDRSLLGDIEPLKVRHENFDPYYSTHHFFGKGNWIWCIPMADEGKELISIGIVFRPDTLKPERVRNMDQFLEYIESEHPHLGRLVKSGRVVDTNVYSNYMYETSQMYSADRWFLVGDAADSSDPLYSTGLLMVSIQCCQVSRLIGQELETGELSESVLRDLEGAYKAVYRSIRNEISDIYSVIGDPYQAHWRVHVASAGYFFFVLPAVLSGYFFEQTGARFIQKVFKANQRLAASINALLMKAGSRVEAYDAGNIPNLYFETVDWKLTGPNEAQLADGFSRLSWLLVKYRWKMIRDAGWWRVPGQWLWCVAGILNAAAVKILFLKPLSQNKLVRRLLAMGLSLDDIRPFAQVPAEPKAERKLSSVPQ